jgi:hypothetical protein
MNSQADPGTSTTCMSPAGGGRPMAPQARAPLVWHDDKWILLVTAEGQFLSAHQDKKGALAIFPTIVILIGKQGIFHCGLILSPDVDFPVGIVSEEPLVVLLLVFFLVGRCCIILHLVWIVIVVLLGGL